MEAHNSHDSTEGLTKTNSDKHDSDDRHHNYNKTENLKETLFHINTISTIQTLIITASVQNPV